MSLKFFKKLLKQIAEVIKLYKFFFILFFYIFITLTYCPYLDNIFQQRVVNDPFFFAYVTLFGFVIKIYMFVRNYKITFSFFPNISDFNLKMFNLTYSNIKINFVKFSIFLKNIIFIKLIGFFKNFKDFFLNRVKT